MMRKRHSLMSTRQSAEKSSPTHVWSIIKLNWTAYKETCFCTKA